MGNGKYRYRTALRERLPERLAGLISKGRGECGDHEWYKSAEHTWRCYHCEPGLTHTVPWDDREISARQLEAGAIKIRAGVEHPSREPVSHT